MFMGNGFARERPTLSLRQNRAGPASLDILEASDQDAWLWRDCRGCPETWLPCRRGFRVYSSLGDAWGTREDVTSKDSWRNTRRLEGRRAAEVSGSQPN